MSVLGEVSCGGPVGLPPQGVRHLVSGHLVSATSLEKLVSAVPSGGGRRGAGTARPTTVLTVLNFLLLVSHSGPETSLKVSDISSGHLVWGFGGAPVEGVPSKVSRRRCQTPRWVSIVRRAGLAGAGACGGRFPRCWSVVCRRSLVQVVHSRHDTSHGGTRAVHCARPETGRGAGAGFVPGAGSIDARRRTQAEARAPSRRCDPGPRGEGARRTADATLGLDGTREGTGGRALATRDGIRLPDGRPGGSLSAPGRERALPRIQATGRTVLCRVRHAGNGAGIGPGDDGRQRRGRGRLARMCELRKVRGRPGAAAAGADALRRSPGTNRRGERRGALHLHAVPQRASPPAAPLPGLHRVDAGRAGPLPPVRASARRRRWRRGDLTTSTQAFRGEWSATEFPSVSRSTAMYPGSPMSVLGIRSVPPAPRTRSRQASSFPAASR
jgi:hypothetical protein